MYDTVSRDSTNAIRQRIAHVFDRIARACKRAGREVDSVVLIAVTKTYGLEVVREALAAGITDFGENRIQELKLKAQSFPGMVNGGNVRWHMIGHIQRNKAKDVVAYADFVHSLDSRRLATELDHRAADAGRVLPCLVQVNVSDEQSKYGLNPADVPGFMEELVKFRNLQIRGFMTLASPTSDPETVRPQFKLLRSIMREVRSKYAALEHMDVLSMGMSGDFEVAIEEGATHVRIGSALFGERS